MAPAKSTLVVRAPSDLTLPIDSSQTLRAATALVRKIQSNQASHKTTSAKPDLLADADEEDAEDGVAVWLLLTTKKHIIDKKRLKPGKIALPHPYLNIANPNLRICLITTDPQRAYKDLIAQPSFPLELAKRIGRVIGLKKLKAKYYSFESRRQLYNEYDVFLADDRIITQLPKVLGKVFYKTGSKRPVPITLEGKRQNFDEQGNKRRKLSEGGSKVVKSEVRPTDVARELERALSSALVHLAPSTSTAVKVGMSSMEPKQIQENVESVTQTLVEKYVPQKWQNVKAVHIKGADTVALPIWLADEMWQDENDVLEEPLPVKVGKKRKRGALADAAGPEGGEREIIEVPGGDGEMRRLERPVPKGKSIGDSMPASIGAKKSKRETQGSIDSQVLERAERAARKEALQKQKAAVKDASNGVNGGIDVKVVGDGGAKVERRKRSKAADLI